MSAKEGEREERTSSSSSVEDSHANAIFQLRDNALRRKYCAYNLEQESALFPLVLSAALLIAGVFFIGVAAKKHEETQGTALCILCSIFAFAVSALGFLMASYHREIARLKRSDAHTRTQRIAPLRRRLYVANHVYLLCFQCFTLLFVVRRAVHDVCVDLEDSRFEEALRYFFCGQMPETYLAYDTVFLLVFGPAIMAKVMPSIDVCLLWAQMLSSMSVFAAITAAKGQLPSVFFLMIWCVSNIFLIANIQANKMKSFYLYRRLKELMRENEKSAEEFHVNEMRYLIANVAHDLKTPLMSFTSAIDLISSYTEETLRLEYTSCATFSDAFAAYLRNVQTCTQSLMDTNAFMLMTINRCIDYAKASKGMQLTPRLETVDLREALRLPLLCMRNVQNRVGIALGDWPRELCTHSITDKQWLQENVLCLLSNAVKYTSHGSVRVTVSLTHTQTNNNSGHDCEMALCDGNLSTQKSDAHAHILFEVEDTGIGVPPDAMRILFRPFKQTQRLAGGTGLGLFSLAKRVDALHGTYGVHARSDGQSGSVFWFSIPYRPDPVTAAAVAAAQEESKNRSRTSSQVSAHSSLTMNPLNEHAFANNNNNNNRLSSKSNRDHNNCGEYELSSFSANGSPSLLPSQLSNHDSHNSAPLPLSTPNNHSNCNNNSNSNNSSEDNARLRVLLVDDSLSIVKLTSMTLRKLGHAISTAENGEVAVRSVESLWREEGACFDVILMDLQMPVMDGLEATRRIRNLEGVLAHCERDTHTDAGTQRERLLPRQFIVCVSANSDHATEKDALSRGADAFITKPFTVDSFIRLAQQRFRQHAE